MYEGEILLAGIPEAASWVKLGREWGYGDGERRVGEELGEGGYDEEEETGYEGIRYQMLFRCIHICHFLLGKLDVNTQADRSVEKKVCPAMLRSSMWTEDRRGSHRTHFSTEHEKIKKHVWKDTLSIVHNG